MAGGLSAGTTEGDGVLRVLNDAVQFLTHGQLQALVCAPAVSGAGQLLAGDDVTFFKAVSVATEGLGVQQSSSGDAWIHTDRQGNNERGRVQAGVPEHRPHPSAPRSDRESSWVALAPACVKAKNTLYLFTYSLTQSVCADFSAQQTCLIRLSDEQSEVSVGTQPPQINMTQNGRKRKLED